MKGQVFQNIVPACLQDGKPNPWFILALQYSNINVILRVLAMNYKRKLTQLDLQNASMTKVCYDLTRLHHVPPACSFSHTLYRQTATLPLNVI
jgi:hypothetical protein